MNWNIEHRRPSSARGFSLIELMITIVVAAVLLAIAIPGFNNLILSNKLTTVNNEWVTAINVARSEAIKRNGNVVICGATGNDGDLTTGCGNDANLGEVRIGSDGTPPFTVVREALAADLPSGIALADTTTIRFGGNGVGRRADQDAPYSGPVAEIGAPDLAGGTYRCIELVSGTIVTTEDGACN
ncbi:GspH/FimT family pseudopilin [Guyparkeria sp.]|uniref:GspH/FimT family pseudopilin n=1 Tax=Guyparkeria sp. TaxID=2035736 RepID=UPI0039710F11